MYWHEMMLYDQLIFNFRTQSKTTLFQHWRYLPYNIYTITKPIAKMQNMFSKLQNSATLLNFVYYFPFLSNYSLECMLSPSFTEKVEFDEKDGNSNRMPTETSFCDEYKSQLKKNIILNIRPTLSYKKLKVSKITESDEQTTKVPRKPLQKQTRNVSSNLMRIFLKNLIELKVYQKKVNLILARFGNNFTQEDFYQWIQGFAINFKNYIRISQVAKIINSQQPQHFRETFLILLNHYTREMGLQHCLTSKRIERGSLKMHLQGLRNINSEFVKHSQTKK